MKYLATLRNPSWKEAETKFQLAVKVGLKPMLSGFQVWGPSHSTKLSLQMKRVPIHFSSVSGLGLGKRYFYDSGILQFTNLRKYYRPDVVTNVAYCKIKTPATLSMVI